MNATPARSNLETARNYLRTIEQGATGEALAGFFTPDVMHQEFPNRLSPHGRRSNLAGMLEGVEKGQKILSKQRYEIQHEMESGNRVALEVLWTGTMAVAVAGLPAGGEMRAHFAVFLEFRDGRIAAQRNYDCFEPW
ncbi:MAG TPA: nuclear transport factor 2 family protein [Candidatus Limnocylindrales bacterium]|jgi:ketosteroid isomerase-like protein|nr:nuclear transport factor 2 family protein [Candidatus Limnocylindrales bacterium]